MRRRFNLFLNACLALGSIVGCGASDAPVREFADVTGKVTYQGVPLKMGQITFQPETGAFATGEIQPDGTYQLKAEIGPNTVTIVSRDPAPVGPDDPAKRNSLPPPKSHIPERYSERKSGLTFEVQDLDNQADFDLK